MPERAALVSGEVVFREGARSFTGATVYVRLEDVSRMDAPSRLVVQEVMPGVSYVAGSHTTLPFELHGRISDDSASYIVRAHVDVDQDGRVSRGDYVSVENYPVLTSGHGHQVSVQVREVK